MCALEALNKDYIYLTDEAVDNKWSTTVGDQFSGVGAFAEITRINANVPKELDKTEEEMRDFLFENPIDYKLGRGRLGMLRVHTAVEPKHIIVEKGIPFDEKPLEFGNSQDNVVNVASVTYKDGNVQVRSWKDPRVSTLISEPILVNMKVGKRVCRTLIDLGSGVAGIMSSEFVKDTRIRTSDIRDELYLRYGNGEISLANDFTTRLNCNIQGKTFLQRFVVSPAPLPGVDAILGLKFFQEHLGTLSWEGPNKDSVFTFPDGNKWRGDSNPLYADNAIDMCHISAQEASQFIRKIGYDQRTVDVFVISVTQTLIDKGYMGPGKPDKNKIPKIIQELLDEFIDRMVPLLPEDLPDARATDGSAQMDIPIIEGSIPVKLRAYNMSNALQNYEFCRNYYATY